MSNARTPAESGQGVWPKEILVARQRPGDRPLIDSTGRKPPGWKSIETHRYVPASLCEELVEALRYITGEDVAGMEGHQRPEDVALAALERYREAVAKGGGGG